MAHSTLRLEKTPKARTVNEKKRVVTAQINNKKYQIRSIVTVLPHGRQCLCVFNMHDVHSCLGKVLGVVVAYPVRQAVVMPAVVVVVVVASLLHNQWPLLERALATSGDRSHQRDAAGLDLRLALDLVKSCADLLVRREVRLLALAVAVEHDGAALAVVHLHVRTLELEAVTAAGSHATEPEEHD